VQTPGDRRPRKGQAVLRRARWRRAWMCPYAVVSLQKSTGGFGPEKPFPQTHPLERAARGRGERGPGPADVRIVRGTSRQPWRAASYEALSCADQACGGEPRASGSRRSAPTRWLQPPRGPPPRKPHGAILWGKPGEMAAQSPLERVEEEQRGPCRRKAPRAGKSLAASRRWGGSGLGGSRRIGQRASRIARTGIEHGTRQGRQRHGRCSHVGSEEHAPTKRAAARPSDVERRETLSSSVARGGNPSRARPTKSR
jgi:hypothetical protein